MMESEKNEITTEIAGNKIEENNDILWIFDVVLAMIGLLVGILMIKKKRRIGQ